MNKKVINEEQFRKLVIKEAGKILSENAEDTSTAKNKRTITFDKVESLINEMNNMNKSITSINTEIKKEVIEGVMEIKKGPNRDLDVNKHNKNKNIIHVNEGEKDKWSRMLKYEVPSDNER